MNKDLISIVIPTYNRASLIGKTIESVLQQEYKSFELIVIDDGSTDNTRSVIESFHDQRIRYISQPNSERGAARNNGVRHANGYYITFLDSDDYFYPFHLSKFADVVRKDGDAELICFSYEIRNPGKTTRVVHTGDINTQLADGNLLSCNGVFVRHDIAKKEMFSEDRNMSGLEDWELWLRLATKYTFKPYSEITSAINQHDERSVMNVTPASLENKFNAFFKAIETNNAICGYYKGRISRLYCSCYSYIALHLALTKKYRKESIRWLIKSLAVRPGSIFSRRTGAVLKHLF